MQEGRVSSSPLSVLRKDHFGSHTLAIVLAVSMYHVPPIMVTKFLLSQLHYPFHNHRGLFYCNFSLLLRYWAGWSLSFDRVRVIPTAGAVSTDDQWQKNICETAFCESMCLVVHDLGTKNLGIRLPPTCDGTV